MIHLKTILITGSSGFIGKNLVTALKNMGTFTLRLYDQENALTDLEEFVKEADFIVHLAGVNRTQDVSDFQEVNVNLTQHILTLLDTLGKTTPILATSSVQALNDTPYGQSKADMENLLLNWSYTKGSNMLLYRLPSVFGKWSRPNYNSVVATFCYNISRDLPIEIHDPRTQLTLVYIDDLIRSMVDIISNSDGTTFNGFCSIYPSYGTTLIGLADTLRYFRAHRTHLAIDNLQSDLEKKLYATYLSYLDPNDFAYSLSMKSDERGWLSEFIKARSLGQIFISKTVPGASRGNHWHQTKAEKFLVLEGSATISLRSILNEDVIHYEVSGDALRVIDIPVGYTHSITNTGDTDLITLFWANEIFDSNSSDTFEEEVQK